MQKWLKSIIILCSLISCNTQGNKPTNITNFNSMKLNIKDKIKTENLYIDASEALIFLINVLTKNTVANNIKIYTDEKINAFIIYFTPQQIDEMVTNIIKVIEIKKNIKDNIKILNDDDNHMPTHLKMSLINQLNEKLEKEINNYKIAIKIAANHESFDVAKTNIQNISITKIIEIQDESKRAVDLKNEITMITNAQIIENNLDPSERNALQFIKKTLQDTTINTNNTIYTNNKIYKFINYLREQQIKEMVANTLKALEEIENAKANIKMIVYMSQQNHSYELFHKLEKEINNYKIAIKIAADHESFDVTKINIQNIPITNITKIKDEAKRAVDVQNTITAHLPGPDLQYEDTIFYLKKIFPEGNSYTYDTFNKFILNIHLDKAKYLLTHFTKEFTMINNTVKIVNRIKNTSHKSKLNFVIQQALKDLQQSMRTAFGNGTHPLDTIKQNFQNVNFHKFEEIKTKVLQIYREENLQIKK
ncbi:putative lipoprotein (plasmid) [Borrelia duttonii Ly]|uniref:Lipoprotein n=2 Tax=Borrelia duttonii TaxID=40834 RepID=B5RNG0_BORDL|nr:putative lipoprotein [Borrelia duttonii Ly]